jgi:hypothetical protein
MILRDGELRRVSIAQRIMAPPLALRLDIASGFRTSKVVGDGPLGLGASGSNLVGVQVPLSAPHFKRFSRLGQVPI